VRITYFADVRFPLERANGIQSMETCHALAEGGHDVTLKKFYRENGQVRLQPANPTMTPIVVPADQIQVQGVVVGVMRRY